MREHADDEIIVRRLLVAVRDGRFALIAGRSPIMRYSITERCA